MTQQLEANPMSAFVVAVFSDTSMAKEGVLALQALASNATIRLHGAAIVSKNPDGKLSMTVLVDEGHAVTAAGALIGGLAGLAIGPLAAAILAAGGAVFGASAALTNRGAGKALAEKISGDLSRDNAAVVADVTTEDMRAIIAELEALGGTVMQQEETGP